ncbi:MAG TPA: hypothetical protein VKT81_08075 [Bryobacteraceae bacterium]|nr:hypothetical protein [Bryobacteraceae bacterium]
MKYWGLLLAKLVAAGLLIGAVWHGIHMSFPQRVTIFLSRIDGSRAAADPFAHDLGYTTLMMVFFLFCVGLLYLVIWDQRYRCRTCARRLRMPMHAGSWPNMLLFGQPRTEYICLYGHGTLFVPEVEISGSRSADWHPHEDMWRELESLEAGKR